jgi:hypothetical protein
MLPPKSSTIKWQGSDAGGELAVCACAALCGLHFAMQGERVEPRSAGPCIIKKVFRVARPMTQRSRASSSISCHWIMNASSLDTVHSYLYLRRITIAMHLTIGRPAPAAAATAMMLIIFEPVLILIRSSSFNPKAIYSISIMHQTCLMSFGGHHQFTRGSDQARVLRVWQGRASVSVPKAQRRGRPNAQAQAHGLRVEKGANSNPSTVG